MATSPNIHTVERDRTWWREKLDEFASEAGPEAFHEFATDHRRPATPSGQVSAPIVERLDAAEAGALVRLAEDLQVGVHAVLLTLLREEIRRRDGRQNMILGSAADGIADLVPLILHGNRAAPLASEIRATQAAWDEAAEHGAFPHTLLYRELRERHPHALTDSRPCPFDIALAAAPAPAGLDLHFSYAPAGGGGMELRLLRNPDVYREDTAQSWLRSFAAWVRWLAEDIGRAASPLPALLPQELQRLAQWERGPVRSRPARRFHELFESVADRYPERTGVAGEAAMQNYGDLERRANRIALALLESGVNRQEPVAVLTECSAGLPATVLGIWKAGAVYVPLALDYPPARLLHMAEDSGARTLIVLDGHAVPPELAEAVRTILRPESLDLDAGATRPAIPGTPQDLAYIIYTSGTTGPPKGVLIQHDSLINAAYCTGEIFGLSPDDRFALAATPSFDASLWELGAALLHGMAVVPVPRTVRDDPWALKQYYKTHGVTVAFHAPSYLRVSKRTPFEGLRVLITGGEAPTHDDARHYAGDVSLWNAYGPTETCIFVCAERIAPEHDTSRPLPVGRPMANTRFSIRRDNGEPAPPGVKGEVWVGGLGLARGYRNNPDLTAQRFIDTPDGRFYRSGDLGRWTEDGLLELSGRIDRQVKFHGQRLELSEVEEALSGHPAVEEAVALVKPSANETLGLWAFVRLRTGAAAPPSENEWREYLGGRLPQYMVPAGVVPLAAIPLNPAGKIDHDALMLSAKRSTTAGMSPPGSELEMRVAAVWSDLLGCSVSREDNFFLLGGNSLLAATMAHRLSLELDRRITARVLFAAPTLAGFAQRIAAILEGTAGPASLNVPTVVRSDLATEGQREFFVAETAGLDTRTFNIPVLCAPKGGTPPLEKWNEAWAALVARHEALRTYFREDAQNRLRRAADATLTPVLEIARRPGHSAARAFVRQRQGEPFRMGMAPLWRAGLVEVEGSGEQLFWLVLHHSVGDGRSIGILLEELGALLRGEKLPLLSTDFAESAAREEAYLAGPACAEDRRYWTELLSRQPASAFDEGPLDFARSAPAKTGNHRFEARVDPATTRGLQALARTHEASLHAVLLTLLALEARRRTGRSEIIIGTAASVRETAAEANVVGYYVNMLPVPCSVPRQSTFGAALRETQQTLTGGLEHQRYPFARMYHDFWSEHPERRHPTRYPLFDMVATENPVVNPPQAGLHFSSVSAPVTDGPIAYERTSASPGQDMALTHELLADGGLQLQWHVNAAVYTRRTAENWLQALIGWAEWLAEDAARAGEPLPAVLPHEAAILESWERGATVARPALRFHELFERVLDGMGSGADRPAVVTESGTTTYGTLECEANAIAHALRQCGVTAGQVVAVLTGRSARLPAAVLGIWKAGAVYLPLAADLPPERLAFMAGDAGAALLMALDGHATPPELSCRLPPAFRPEEMDPEFRRTHAHRPEAPGSAADAAYIIYTSGSTGTPKGVLVTHDAYINSVFGSGEALGFTPGDRSLMFSSPSFDASLSDIGMPLAFGASLCPVPNEVLSSPNRFRTFLAALSVTVADITPSYLRLFDGAPLPSLRVLVTGGEAPFAADVKVYAARHEYFNAYGPTENAITSTVRKLNAADEVLSGGRPLPNTSVHVCDSDGLRVPPGVVGELWLGGAGLAQGYVGRPGVAAAAFVETAQGRRYRSGDLGRWLPNGEIEILGRVDDQVKLNGIRIELGEIECALASHPDIAQAVAVLDSDAQRNHSLWGFVRAHSGKQAPSEENWRGFLARRLPAYMIPSAIIAVPEIPLANSGKVDKAALKRFLAGRAAREEQEPPQPGLEAKIAGVWSDLLGRAAIHRDDNFFALGGHSLLAIAVAHRLEKMLGRPVPARELFAEPTLRTFAHRVVELEPAAVAVVAPSDLATSGQREFWIAEQAGLDTRGFIIPLTLAPCGDVPPVERWRRAWTELVLRHDALRTSFYEDRDGVLHRSTLTEPSANLEIASLPDLPTAIAHIRERQADPFRMAIPPLWRAGLVQINTPDQLIFWLALHHSIGDGASLGVLADELSSLLRGEKLPPVLGRFDEAAGREESYLAGDACREDAQYWKTALGGLGAGLSDVPQPFDEWLLDFPRPAGHTERNTKGSHCFHSRLDAARASKLREFARSNGASLHALMLTILAHEVRRRTGRPEFVVGTAASTRDFASDARVVGYFINMLPVPCRVHGRDSIEQLLRIMQQSLADALRHGRYPFARIYQDFRRDHDLALHPARYPLFDLAVTENPAAERNGSLVPFAGGDVRYDLRVNSPGQDMVLVHESQPDGSLILHWYVNAAIYEKETAEQWFNSLTGWALFLADGQHPPGIPAPELLPEEENLLAGWEHGPALQFPAPSLPARLEHWARTQPDRAALVTEDGIQSYGALNARANALAHALLALGVQRQEPVGVFTDRSVFLPETVLAIWKAGGCYLPLVTELPADRMAFIIRDAGVRVLVVLDGYEPPTRVTEAGSRIFRPESLTEDSRMKNGHSPELPGGASCGSELAYIIYTSGSTGTPKGVLLHHQGLMNLGVGMVGALGIRGDDRCTLIASPAFDAWVADLASAWTVGAAVVPILRSEIDDIAGLRNKIARLGVRVATMTPSYLRLFEQADFPGLRLLVTVGESPNLDDARHYAARLRYMNGYGPTENSAATSFGPITPNSRRATAGTPLANTWVEIRGAHGEKVPPGAIGELWLGGIGLASGYLNRPDLTAASFVETAAGRVYRTGDLARWTHTGELEIMGRADGQVKIGGQRVELGEIEQHLKAYPGVRQAVAAVDTLSNGAHTLRAFVCLDSGAAEPTQAAWRHHLSAALPAYMLPSTVLIVPVIPMTVSGKADRAALLRLDCDRELRPDGAPLDGLERTIAEVWAEHLNCGTPGREDSFFDAGGNSLLAIAVVNQLRRTLDCTVNDLYEHPRLADFAGACRPRREHFRALIQSAARHWRDYRLGLAAYEADRGAALAAAMRDYRRRWDRAAIRPEARRHYSRVLLTGSTGYLGAYVLRELLSDPKRHVTALVRGDQDQAARARLGETLCHYFGPAEGEALRDNSRLIVVAGDLRRDHLGLSERTYDLVAENLQAVFHCAANVKHYGHYREFHAANVAGTACLLKLASHHPACPADFHHVSTLSVCGQAPEDGFRLFSEYDFVPQVLDGNYYVRSKQEAEQCVVAARQYLANACIHRVGNLVFAASGGPLQQNIAENAFFRQIAALLRLGVVPDDSALWLSHVDVVSRALVLLAGSAALSNETHHLENSRRDSLARFVTAAGGVCARNFGTFLERLEAAVDEPGMDAALASIMEDFGLFRGQSPQPRARRLQIISERTQALLAQIELSWPPPPAEGQAEMLRQAATVFAGRPSTRTAEFSA